MFDKETKNLKKRVKYLEKIVGIEIDDDDPDYPYIPEAHYNFDDISIIKRIIGLEERLKIEIDRYRVYKEKKKK